MYLMLVLRLNYQNVYNTVNHPLHSDQTLISIMEGLWELIHQREYFYNITVPINNSQFLDYHSFPSTQSTLGLSKKNPPQSRVGGRS